MAVCLVGTLALDPCLAADSPELEDQSYRVMTFNIRYDNPQDGEDAWRHRQEGVARLIRDAAVDIFGVQEALARQVDALARQLPDYAWYGVGREDGQRAGEHGPVFFRKDRFTLEDRGEFWLCAEPTEPGRLDWGAACPRMATWARLKDRTNQREVLFFNTHFDHRSSEARLNSAQLILQRMSDRQPLPMLLVGDMNCLAGTAPLRHLTDSDPAGRFCLVDSLPAAPATGRHGPESTWNGFQEIVPGRRIDFVLAGPGWQVQKHTVRDDRVADRFLSDHLPVIVDLQLAKVSSRAE